MHVLAYFLSTSSVLPEVEAGSETTRIFFGSRRTDEGDEEHLNRFSEIFMETSSLACAAPGPLAETTCDRLRKQLPFTWFDDEKYDTVNPFGDPRQLQYHSLWTFDTRSCMLHHTNATGRREIPFSRLRECPVSLADMRLLGGPVPKLSVPTTETNTSFWRPQIEVDSRVCALTYRLLYDFHHQWRHILRNEYNSVTFRKLARAIIRLATLDFEVRENTGGHGRRGPHVWITQSPSWEPLEGDILRVGTLWIVLCEDILKGLSLAQQHYVSLEFTAYQNSKTTESGAAQAHYMILSVKYIMLCRATGPNSLKHTAPERLYNGDYSTSPPSAIAIDYLIWATAAARPPACESFQKLPIEVQDNILGRVSLGTVAAAQYSCLLGLGSTFLWKDGRLKVNLVERYFVRPSGSSVESEVWFGDHKSGVVYLAQAEVMRYANPPFPSFESETKL